MIPILNNSNPNRIELNALFIQPTYWCNKACSGCYVRGSKQPLPIPVLTEVFRSFLGTPHWANQISISMDSFQPGSPTGNYMKSVCDGLLSTLNGHPGPDFPEIHLTFRDTQTYRNYDIGHLLGLIDVVTFSHLTGEDEGLIETIQDIGADVNWNLMMPRLTKLNTLSKNIDNIEKIGSWVDSIYLLSKKDTLGRKIRTTNLQEDLFFLGASGLCLSPEIQEKVTVDGCLEDADKFLSTTFSCSANISRMALWPDGSVTGCPYSSNSKGVEGSISVDSIISNIRKGFARRDFTNCEIPCQLAKDRI